jgi:hypothetical protein
VGRRFFEPELLAGSVGWWLPAVPNLVSLIWWLVRLAGWLGLIRLAGCQRAVFFSHIILAPAISQTAIFFFHNKSAPATGHRLAEGLTCCA